MVNIFKQVQKVHKGMMYHDKCDIYKYESVVNANGSKSTKKNPVPVHLDVPCKISFSLRTWDNFTHKAVDTTPYEKQPKLFMEVEYICEPGYYYEARRYDPQTGELIATYKGQGGLPQVCLTHQEILLDVKGNN